MKLTLFAFTAAMLAAAAAAAQEHRVVFNAVTPDPSGHAGGVVTRQMIEARMPLEAQVVKGAPYSAEVVTEFTQTLADGNRIVRRSTGRVYRDSQGRTRREDDAAPGQVRTVRISDPVGKVAYTIDPAARTAIKMQGPVAGAVAAVVLPHKTTDPAETERKRAVEAEIARAVGVGGRATATGGGGRGGVVGGVVAPVKVDGAWEQKTEKLPSRQIEGITAEGTRTTRTIPAGAIGNEQPILVVSEEWRSPELQVLVMTHTSDPRTGETTYRLTNITRAEPDASWFEVPAGFTVKEYGVRLAPVKK